MEHYIITIGREFGSGGHKVGQIVADRLRIPYYDNELVLLATQHGGIETAMFNKYDEKKHNDYLYAVNYSGNENVQKGQSMENTLYELQKKVILNIADWEDAVIVGRSADAILKNAGRNVLTVFIKAPIEYRIKRTMQMQGLPEKTVIALIKKKDKGRRAFYESRTGLVWGNSDHYDLYFDSSAIDYSDIAETIIFQYEKLKNSI